MYEMSMYFIMLHLMNDAFYGFTLETVPAQRELRESNDAT